MAVDGNAFLFGFLKQKTMSDVPFTIVALKASVRRHNKSKIVRLSQRRASLISDICKKNVVFPNAEVLEK